MNIISEYVLTVFNSGFSALAAFLPKLIAGLILLTVGVVLASILKDLIRLVFKYFRLDKWFEMVGLVKENEISIWSNILAELVRWTTIFLFLMSTVDLWGVPKVGEVISQLILFIPNVFVAVVVGLVGFVISNLAFDIVRHGVRGLGSRESLVLGNIAKYAIVFFTILIILSQLGVAADLVRILFTGIVAMLSLAFGLSFGLGGREHASKIIGKLMDRLEETPAKRLKR